MVAVVITVIAAMGAPAAKGDFGFKSLASTLTGPHGEASPPAGAHPASWQTTIAFNTSGPPGDEHADGSLRNLSIALPAGLVGAPELLPNCSRDDFLGESCPPASRVGTVAMTTSIPGLPPSDLYLIEPPAGTIAQLGFLVESIPITFDLSLDPDPPYSLIATTTNASQAAVLFSAALTLEGIPGGVPFLTLPRSCGSPLTVFSASPWQLPATAVTAAAPLSEPIVDCASLAYAPSLGVAPTTGEAGAPSGLDLDLSAPDAGISSGTGRAAADTAAVSLELPPGLTLNPPVVSGLSGCSPAQLESELADADPATGCPQSSKIGTGMVTTPLLGTPIGGSIHLAEPDDPATVASGAENPFDARFAVYLVLRQPERGILLHLPIRLDADPETGQLSASVPQIPELPIDHLSLRLNSGPRAPLSTPLECGQQEIDFALTPSSGNAPVTGSDPFSVSSSCNKAFTPTLAAGATSPAAASSTPLVFDVGNDGGSNLDGLDFTLPPGLSASLARVSTCPETAGLSGSCPPASRLGYAEAALGSGPAPLWAPSQPGSAGVFLAGPYRGAPYSVLVEFPTRIGPFDLGTVVIRAAVEVDPDTVQARLRVDPLPQIRAGVPLRYRKLRLVIDRPGFIRNPTSCTPRWIAAVATAVDGTRAPLTAPFQASGCAALAFKPKLALQLSGALGRNGHPSLRALLRARPGDAGIAAVGVTLPPLQLLDFQRLPAVCAKRLLPQSCPPDSRLGRARVWSPILEEPLAGPIYLRSPTHRLPDLLADLHGGGIDIRLHGRIAASDGRLRVSFPSLPDVPLSKALITVAGGPRGMLVNSESVCRGLEATVIKLRAHNGKQRRLHPPVRARGRC
jgi:hypothetical protein